MGGPMTQRRMVRCGMGDIYLQENIMSEAQNTLATIRAGETVEWAPVNIRVVGKNLKERRESVINNGLSIAAATYLSNMKGKTGDLVRSKISDNGVFLIAK